MNGVRFIFSPMEYYNALGMNTSESCCMLLFRVFDQRYYVVYHVDLVLSKCRQAGNIVLIYCKITKIIRMRIYSGMHNNDDNESFHYNSNVICRFKSLALLISNFRLLWLL